MNPRALNPMSTSEVPLPQAPLARVIAQIRFPSVLAVHNPDTVAEFQEKHRHDYPFLTQDHVHSIELAGDQTPNVHHGIVWRLADQENAIWRVSLGVDFVALETSSYDSRSDFLNRLDVVVSSVEQIFKPVSASRIGLRYIDRLTDGAVDRIGELIQPGILGIMKPSGSPEFMLGDSVIHQITETQFLAPESARIQGRWGLLPANMTYDPDALEPVAEKSWILDLDMFKMKSHPFSSETILTTSTDFAECLHWLFRQMVTEEFLRFYGGVQ